MPDEPFNIATVVSGVLEHRFVKPSVRDYKLDALNGGHDLALNIPQEKPYNQPPNLVSNLTKYQKGVEFRLDEANPRTIRWKHETLEGHIHVSYFPPDADGNGLDFTAPLPGPKS